MLGSRKSKSENTKQGKELAKLRRQDLLELLLDQMHENDDLRSTLELQLRQNGDLTALTDRLKDRLTLKDGVIDRLKKRLDLKDAMIAQLLAQGREMPSSSDLLDMGELLDVEGRALEAYLVQSSGEIAKAEATAAEAAEAVEELAKTTSIKLPTPEPAPEPTAIVDEVLASLHEPKQAPVVPEVDPIPAAPAPTDEGEEA